MSAEYFLDTNIIVYAFDQTASDKKSRALRLIEEDAPWQISWQVIQEFASVALHHFSKPLDADFLRDFSELLLWPHCTVGPTAAIHTSALQIHQQSSYRFYDSLIIAAALECGVPFLYSEDLQHGRRFGDLEIRNPFLPE